MSRRFPDWLGAFEAYAADNFSPPQFHTWAGLSALAAALERKVWLPWTDTYSFYPNIYILLVSKPGQGKTISMNKAVGLLEEVNRKTSTLNIMPPQVTQSKFIELMGHGRSFIDKSSGKELTVFQNAGYYYAGEASNELTNIFGDFIACLTAFYDCPAKWSRATKKDGETSLTNVCMNLIACSTFDYLGKLVSDENIQGGFASRLLYVVEQDTKVKEQMWQNGQDAEMRRLRDEYRTALVADLVDVNKMTGPMTGDTEFAAAWEAWYPEHQRKLHAFKSEKLQSILARTNTNVLKVSMLLSAAESNDRIMRKRHFEKAVELIEALNTKVPDIFRQSKIAQGPKLGSSGYANFVIDCVKRQSFATADTVRNAAVTRGYPVRAINDVIQSLLGDGVLITGTAIGGKGTQLVVKGNADDYL